MAKRLFYKVDQKLLRDLGTDEAVLFAILENAGKVWKKDENGYFAIFTTYLMQQTGWWQGRITRVRKKLVDAGLLDFIPGKNQNLPGRYKINR